MLAYLGVMVQLLQPFYAVIEGLMTVEVCVIRNGGSDEPITVTLNTRESNPPDAVGE